MRTSHESVELTSVAGTPCFELDTSADRARGTRVVVVATGKGLVPRLVVP